MYFGWKLYKRNICLCFLYTSKFPVLCNGIWVKDVPFSFLYPFFFFAVKRVFWSTFFFAERFSLHIIEGTKLCSGWEKWADGWMELPLHVVEIYIRLNYYSRWLFLIHDNNYPLGWQLSYKFKWYKVDLKSNASIAWLYL